MYWLMSNTILRITIYKCYNLQQTLLSVPARFPAAPISLSLVFLMQKDL